MCSVGLPYPHPEPLWALYHMHIPTRNLYTLCTRVPQCPGTGAAFVYLPGTSVSSVRRLYRTRKFCEFCKTPVNVPVPSVRPVSCIPEPWPPVSSVRLTVAQYPGYRGSIEVSRSAGYIVLSDVISRRSHAPNTKMKTHPFSYLCRILAKLTLLLQLYSSCSLTFANYYLAVLVGLTVCDVLVHLATFEFISWVFEVRTVWSCSCPRSAQNNWTKFQVWISVVFSSVHETAKLSVLPCPVCVFVLLSMFLDWSLWAVIGIDLLLFTCFRSGLISIFIFIDMQHNSPRLSAERRGDCVRSRTVVVCIIQRIDCYSYCLPYVCTSYLLQLAVYPRLFSVGVLLQGRPMPFFD